MRPRGESISSPHSTYVGQLGRQKPQWTQSPTSAAEGGLWSSKAASPHARGATDSGPPSPFVAVVAFTAVPATCSDIHPPRPDGRGTGRTLLLPMRCELLLDQDLRSDPPDEPAGSESMLRVELVLHPPHQIQATDRTPHVDALLHPGRTVEDHDVTAPGGRRLAQGRDRGGHGLRVFAGQCG